MCPAAECGLLPHRSLAPSLCPSLIAGLLRVMTAQKFFTQGVGPAFCGSASNGRCSNAMSFRPGSPSHAPPLKPHCSCGISKDRDGTLQKTPGSFCVLQTWDLPAAFHNSQWETWKPLLRDDGFTCLIIMWIWRWILIIYLHTIHHCKIPPKKSKQAQRYLKMSSSVFHKFISFLSVILYFKWHVSIHCLPVLYLAPS